VEHWVQKVCEPDLLYLAWQAPDPAVRYRWAVGVLTRHSEGLKLRYFRKGPEFERYNHNRSYEELERLGFRGYPAFSLQQEEHVQGTELAFMRRLPPRSRSDFVEYTKLFRLPADIEVSNMSLLGLTEAKLPSDGFSIVDPLSPGASACDIVLEVAGYRYYASAVTQPPAVGDLVEFVTEDENTHDANAVAIRVSGTVIGYVNRLQAATFRVWLQERQLQAWIERLNGDRDRPRAFVFVEVRSRSLNKAA
jgi:hypothetical protein